MFVPRQEFRIRRNLGCSLGYAFLLQVDTSLKVKLGGDEGHRTLDLNVANVMLSQLSYIPKTSRKMVPGDGIEPPTLAL